MKLNMDYLFTPISRDRFSPLYDQTDLTIATSKVEMIAVVEFIDSSTSSM